MHREPATPAGGEVKTVCNTTNICQHYELVCEVNVYVTELTPEVPRVPQVPRIDLGGYPYNVPAAASGMGLEPMEIVEPGDPAVMQARVPVIIQPGADEAAGLGWIFAFRPGRAFKELREQQEERHDLQYEMGPLDGGPAKGRTARCSTSACMGPASSSTPASSPAMPTNAPTKTFGPGMWRSLELSFAVSPLAAPSPIELPAGVVPPLSNRYSLGLSLDLVELGHRSTYDQTHEKSGVAERVKPKDPNGRGSVYTAKQHRVFPGPGQAAVAECHAEHEDQWILRRLEYIVKDPNVNMAEGVRQHLTTALRIGGTRDEVWARIFAGHADDEAFRRELKRVVDSAMPTRQEIYDLAAECDARSSRFILAVNSTLHLQNINADFSVPHWRANVVGTVRLGRRDEPTNKHSSTSMGPAPGWRVILTGQLSANALPEQVDGDRWMFVNPLRSTSQRPRPSRAAMV